MSEASPVLAGYLTKEQLAQQLGISPRTLARWELLRQGPPRVALGRTVLYRVESVHQWLAAKETRARRAR